MDLRLSEEQQALDHAVRRFLGKAASPERVRASEPLGFDQDTWRGLPAMGVPAMGVATDASPSGGGAALADLAVVAHACGAHLAPVPVVKAMVTHRLLATLGAASVEPSTVVTMAVRPAVAGRATLVPAGAVAEALVVLDGPRLVLPQRSGGRTGRAVTNLGRVPLADIEVDVEVDVDVDDGGAGTILATGDDAHRAFARALDEWRALTAVWLHGLGSAALDLGVQYAQDRHQFGVPIGSFQAVQHRLADVHTDLDGAWLLAQKAVWALDQRDQRAVKAQDDDASGGQLASMAFAFAGQAAEVAAAGALHYHGGYGFMEEYDIQLYFRRAKAARLVLGDPRQDLQVVADRLFGPVEPRAR